MNNEFTDMIVNLIVDFAKMFQSEIKSEMLSIMPNTESLILFAVVSLFVIIMVSRILRTSIFGFVGTVVKLGSMLIIAALVISVL